MRRLHELRQRLRRQPVGRVDQAGPLSDELGDRAKRLVEAALVAVGHVGDVEPRGAVVGDRRPQLVEAPRRHNERRAIDPSELQLVEHVADDRAVGDALERSVARALPGGAGARCGHDHPGQGHTPLNAPDGSLLARKRCRASKVRPRARRCSSNGSGAIELELTEIIRTLRARWVATTLVVALAIGAAAAIKLTSHNVPTGAATVQILVDSPSSELASLTENPTPLISRGGLRPGDDEPSATRGNQVLYQVSVAAFERTIAAAVVFPA